MNPTRRYEVLGPVAPNPRDSRLIASCCTRSTVPAKTGTNAGMMAANPDPRMPRDRCAASTIPTSRWSTGTSWRVRVIIRLSTYGTRSLASAANRSDGCVVWSTTMAATSIARIRRTNTRPRVTPSA